MHVCTLASVDIHPLYNGDIARDEQLGKRIVISSNLQCFSARPLGPGKKFCHHDGHTSGRGIVGTVMFSAATSQINSWLDC
jgi:hypothetical protein